MFTLELFIQGSSSLPYRITAEGEGRELRMFCTCPRGRKGGKFCKHLAMLLVGDISKLVSPPEDVAVLQRRSIGSPLVGLALAYPVDKSTPLFPPGMSTLDHLAAHIADTFRADDALVRIHGRDGDPERQLGVFGLFKSGKPKRSPHIALNYKLTVVRYDDDNIIERLSARPWSVHVKSRPPRSFSLFSSAAVAFCQELETMLSINRHARPPTAESSSQDER